MNEKIYLPGIHELIQECFYVKYSGNNPCLVAHQIDISKYSSSLRGYGGFIESICVDVLHAKPKVYVRAEKEGSFESFVQIAFEIMEGVSAVVGILSFFGITSKNFGGVLARLQSAMVNYYKKFNGNVKELISSIVDSFELSEEDKQKLIKIYKEEFFLESLDEFTSPLDEPGYERITVSDQDGEVFSVDTAERGYFRYTSPAEERTEYFEDTVEILYISPEFIKWQFKGVEVFWADVLDDNFLVATKNRRSTELKGLKFYAKGRKILSRKEGGKNWRTKWFIDSIHENQGQVIIDLTN